MTIFENAVITNIYSPTSFTFKKGQTDQMKVRKCYGLVFCLKGHIIYKQNGIKYICDPQTAIILTKGASYTWINIEDGIFCLLDFECENLSLKSLTNIPLTESKSYIKDYKLMTNYFLFDNKKLKRFRLLYDIFDRLDFEQSKNPLSAIIEYIETHLSDNNITNGFLAKKIGISEIYFRKLFISNLGVTPKQYILDLRIKKAKQLLINGTHSVTETSEKCGFSTVYHFCRIFKDKTGLTPLEYSKKYKIFEI